jgi:hypothetical protein
MNYNSCNVNNIETPPPTFFMIVRNMITVGSSVILFDVAVSVAVIVSAINLLLALMDAVICFIDSLIVGLVYLGLVVFAKSQLVVPNYCLN